MMGMNAEPSLQGIDLTCTFGAGETLTVALRGVSLNLYPGQMALVMGPSGCGKSTLLAILSGLLHPDTGRVLVHGQDLYAMPVSRRREFRRAHLRNVRRSGENSC